MISEDPELAVAALSPKESEHIVPRESFDRFQAVCFIDRHAWAYFLGVTAVMFA